MSESQMAKLQTLGLRLHQLYISRAKRSFYTLRAKWIQEGGQHSRYFFMLEKQKQNKNSLTRLSSNSTLVDNPKDIDNICKNYYNSM